MARSDFAAGLTAILGGGACYWLAVIRPNATDTFSATAFGTLKTYSLAGYTVMENRLISIADIDNKINPYKGPLHFMPDVQIEVQNVAADMDFSGYQGRIFEIRFGYGATMSEATSSVMFTGKIVDVKASTAKIVFVARGKSQLANKPIGTPVPDDADDKYKGKIYPMTWGDQSDDDAFAPAVLNRAAQYMPDVALDTEALHTFDALYVYDEEAKVGYRAKTSSVTVINSDKNLVAAITDTGDTLKSAIGDMDKLLTTDGAGTVGQYSTAYGAKPLILKIDNELIFVISASNVGGESVCKVERGYLWTTKASHAAGAVIYYYNTDLSNLSILVSNIFYAFGVSGANSSGVPTGSPATIPNPIYTNGVFIYPTEGRYEDVLDKSILTGAKYQGTVSAENSAPAAGYPPYFWLGSRLNLLFPKIGVEGAVVSQYMIFKAILQATIANVHGYLETDYFWMRISAVSDDIVFTPWTYSNNGGVFTVVLAYWPGGYTGDGWILVYKESGSNPATSGVLTLVPTGRTITFSVWYNTQTVATLYLGKGNDSTYQTIKTATANKADADVTEDMNNIDGDEAETDFEISAATGQPAGSLLLSDVSDLPGANYALRLNTTVSPKSTGNVYLTLYRFGMRLDFYVSPLKYYFWWRGKGRKNPGGYYNGSLGDLMENPSSVIEDFIRTADDGSAIMSMTEAYFDAVYTSRAAWKLAHSVYSKDNDRPKLRDALETILTCSGVCCFERFDGSLGIADLDDPGSVTRTIVDAEVKVDSNKNAEVEYSYLPADLMITSIEIKYKPILPEDGEYAAVYKLERNGSGPTEYLGYLQQAYEALGEDRPLVIEAPAIRDADTAEALAFLIIKLRYKPLVQVEIRCKYSALNIELLDKVGTNLTALPAAINAKTFLVTGVRIKPHTNGDKPDVKITLTELGTATITDATIWQDSASAPTNVKTEVASGGRVIMEV